jgi:hypothetical protein
VTLLGSPVALPWTFDSSLGTIVTLPENLQQPENRPCAHAWCLKFETAEARAVTENVHVFRQRTPMNSFAGDVRAKGHAVRGLNRISL